jgi:hypothetical protein
VDCQLTADTKEVGEGPPRINLEGGFGVPQAEDLEIQFNPLYAWLLVAFGCVFFSLGLFIMTPWAVGGSVSGGLLICLASACGFAGGVFWLKHLPVILRFTSQELQLPGSAPVRWNEIETVDVRTIHIRRNPVSYACIKLKTKRNADSTMRRVFEAARDAILGDYDIVLDEQRYARPAEWIAAECRRRLSTNMAEERAEKLNCYDGGVTRRTG